MITTVSTDNEDRALDRKIEQFKGDKPVLDGLIRTFVTQVKDWETVFWEVINARLLDNAEGAQLDIWGKLVAEPRENRSDADFKTAIRLRLRVQRSQGKMRDLFDVTDALLDTIPWSYVEYDIAAFVIRVSNIDGTMVRTLSRALSRTRALGTGGFLLFSTWDESRDFLYTSLADPSAGQNGYGSIYDPDAGGVFCSVRLLTQGQ